MSYSYEQQKPWLFTDEDQRQFLRCRDRARFLSEEAGAFTIEAVLKGLDGDSWNQLACVDRLIELTEYRTVYKGEATQYDVLVPNIYRGK